MLVQVMASGHAHEKEAATLEGADGGGWARVAGRQRVAPLAHKLKVAREKVGCHRASLFEGLALGDDAGERREGDDKAPSSAGSKMAE